jgi:hypothetical protein
MLAQMKIHNNRLILVEQIQKDQKWNELNNLDLNGFNCWYKETKRKKIIYHFHKEVNGGWLNIKSEFDNIEFCLKNGLTLK